MTLQGVILLASLFGPAILGVPVFLRAGLPLLRSLVNALYIFAVCMLTFMGLFLFKRKLGMSEDEVILTLPAAVVLCLGVLVAPHFMRQSDESTDARDESPDERDLS